MQHECHHCKKRFDVPIKTVLSWITSSGKLLAAVKSLIASMNRAAATPESQRRDVDYAELAKKSHAARRENKSASYPRIPKLSATNPSPASCGAFLCAEQTGQRRRTCRYA